ncbi:hypothetical protein WICPIJ_005963, partial [Wickerhamomyces pijperi]
ASSRTRPPRSHSKSLTTSTVSSSKSSTIKGVWYLTGAGSIDGTLAVHTVFSPAFSITKEEVDEIIVRFKKTMAELEAEYDSPL